MSGLTLGLAAALPMAEAAPGRAFVLNIGPSRHLEEEMHYLSGSLKREKKSFFSQKAPGNFLLMFHQDKLAHTAFSEQS